jgi:LPXTG-motif cell wall-anchored protein
VNRPKPSLRRPLAVLGATLVGIAAALAISAPASAHDALLSGDYKCLPSGQWEVTWTLTSKNTDLTATLDAVSYEPANPDAEHIVEGATLPKPGDGVLTEMVLLPGDAPGTGLFVGATFSNGHKASDEEFLEFEGDCKEEQQPEQKSPSVTFESLCDGSVDVTLHNPTREAVTFTVNGKKIEVAADGFDVVNLTGEAAATIVVTWGEDGKAMGGFEPPDTCPTIAATFTCDQLIVEIENPDNGRAFEVTLEPSGGAKETIGVEAGESVTREYDATEGFSVRATAFGATDTFVWEQPEACGGAGGGGGGPELPVTGPQAGAIAGGAGLLLVLGTVLLVLARRRRIRFTA